MAHSRFATLLEEFRLAVEDCERLYISAGKTCRYVYPQWSKTERQEFVQMMADLHRGLLIKIYVTITEADRRWSRQERQLAEELFAHLWGRRLEGDELREATREVSQKSLSLKWYDLVRQFEQIAPLRERIADLETIVMRVANIIAKCDGPPTEAEIAHVEGIEREIQRHLHSIPIDEAGHHEEALTAGSQAIESVPETADRVRRECDLENTSRAAPQDDRNREEILAEAIGELDGLIGLDGIKQEVRTLVNFLRIQQERSQAGLPETELSLHTVFVGNPGTGKTTVARIIAKIFAAMGILTKGHLIETDRSGLVAEYAGQSGPKTNKIIDAALDGVLFVDEAYSLTAAEGDDPFGREAIQTLLKRMEDDRSRLIVILAGYPDEMGTLLGSNPGLSSRFSRQLLFEDYYPAELGQIFGRMCIQNHYELPKLTRVKLMLGFAWLHSRRDRHFGNGRTVRNIFEQSIRCLANRVSAITELTRKDLTELTPDDVAFFAPGNRSRRNAVNVPNEVFGELDNAARRFQIRCPGCGKVCNMPQPLLLRRVRCRACEHRFRAEWGAPASPRPK